MRYSGFQSPPPAFNMVGISHRRPPADGARVTRITCLGSSDAFNSGGRANSCFWVDDAHGAFTVDFGPTALLRIRRLGLDPNQLDSVFVTHLHGDHIGGLAILLCELQHSSGRRAPLTIAGPPGIEGRLAALVDSAYPSLTRRGLGFPLRIVRWRVPGTVERGGRKVTAIRARHDLHAIACSLRVETGAHRLVFSGDTGWQPSLAELAADADLFVCECSDVESGYWAHTSLADIARHRAEITARRLWLTHFGPDSRAAATARAEALDLTVADDGLVLELSP